MSMRKPLALLTLGTLPILAACGGAEAPKTETAAPPAEAPKAAAPAGGAATGTASVSGKISFDGTVPPAEKVKVSADPKCVAMHPNGLEKQTIQVKDGGLANVLVYVKSGASGTYAPPATPAQVDQKGCTYEPHVVVLQVGQPLVITNSDETLHNIHPRPTLNAEFNIGQPKQGMKSTKTFDKPEIMFPVGCDVHPWMRAFVAVLQNPFYAVTKEDGTFEIKGLPTGEYEIEAVHEKLKTLTQRVTVKDGEAARLDLTFKG